jgi:hypothetical protein
MHSGKPPFPGEPRQANSLRLLVFGPDGQSFQLDGVSPNITPRELAKGLAESHYGASSPIGNLTVDLIRDDLQVRLAPRRTLEQNGVTDGDRLSISTQALAGGPFELVAAFVAGAIASGVLGNASYDLLKAVLRRLGKKFRSANDTGLSEQDAADIAVGCCCTRLKIGDPTKVVVYDVWVDAHNIGIYPPPIPDRNIGNVILHTPRGTVSAIILPAADGDPDGLQIELKWARRP